MPGCAPQLPAVVEDRARPMVKPDHKSFRDNNMNAIIVLARALLDLCGKDEVDRDDATDDESKDPSRH
jgi:hypothetical protein